MGNFGNVRTAIVAAIAEASTVQASYGYDRSTFSDGFPAVVVVPTDNQADYGSTEKDRMQFVFVVRAYYPVTNESNHEVAELALEAVVDELIELFTDRDVLGSAADWVRPIPSTWYYEERETELYRVAEITLNCVKYVNH